MIKPKLNPCCLRAINTPEVLDFLEAVKIEAVHQRERWKKNDPMKDDADWYWLVGWLGGKVLTDPHEEGDTRTKMERMLHRIVTVAAAAYNWHGSVKARIHPKKVEVHGGGDGEVLIPALSEKVFEEIGPMAVELVDDIRKKYGARVASNVLTNAMVSATAWQFGNQMGQFGKWDSDQERQEYCTKIAKKLFELLETERPPAT